MTTCTKRYIDIPFAHRQPAHDGHCRHIHGHNWAFEFEFAAREKDQCGFVVDFGKLKELRDWLDEKFDHRLVLNIDDPLAQTLAAAQASTGAKVMLVPDCSCEGLAETVLCEADAIVQRITSGRATVKRVTVFEDSRNSATATAP